jgi:hypothetical protein
MIKAHRFIKAYRFNGRKLTVLLVLFALSGISLFSSANGQGLRVTQDGRDTIAQRCDSQGNCLCVTPDGREVPPGTRDGPYVCLPDGTWS